MNAEADQRQTALYEEARRVREKSYSPYSLKKVGAAILSEEGILFSGCNVENSSYGSTICAERVAIQNGVSQGYKKFTELCVVTDADPPWAPCGMCRQVLSEFADPTLKVHLMNLSGKAQTLLLSELFPHAFGSENLGEK